MGGESMTSCHRIMSGWIGTAGWKKYLMSYTEAPKQSVGGYGGGNGLILIAVLHEGKRWREGRVTGAANPIDPALH